MELLEFVVTHGSKPGCNYDPTNTNHRVRTGFLSNIIYSVRVCVRVQERVCRSEYRFRRQLE